MHSQSGHPAHGRSYESSPLVVTWEVTQACDLTCDHCRADAQPDRAPGELSTAEGKALLDTVAEFDPTPILVFSGGDPLKRPDLFELIDHSVDAGLPTAVTPAPTPLLTESVVEEFEARGVRRMALSLDGATAETHDAFRGEAGSFETITSIAEHARSVGLPLQINTTVTSSTVEELPEIADLVESLDAVMWEVFFLVPIGRGVDLEQLSPAATDDVLEWLYRRQRDAPFRVITVEAPMYRRVAMEIETADSGRPPRVGSTGDGNGFVFVSHTGEVFPSGFLPVSAGNVRERSLVSLYQDDSVFRDLRDRSGLRGVCGDCEYRDRCGGSRARAYAVTEDPMESDPLCSLVDAR